MTPDAPTPEQIEKWLARFNLFAVRQHQNGPALREIAAKLEQVPPGRDNRVDLILGRPCAVLPKRAWLTTPLEKIERDTLALMRKAMTE